jgi:hypothetical protein
MNTLRRIDYVEYTINEALLDILGVDDWSKDLKYIETVILPDLLACQGCIAEVIKCRYLPDNLDVTLEISDYDLHVHHRDDIKEEIDCYWGAKYN